MRMKMFWGAQAAALLLAFAAAPLHAAGVSCLVVEMGFDGGDEGGGQSRKAADWERWESGLMNALFDAGHIVTNFPAIRLGGEPSGGLPCRARESLAAAAEGGMDYLVITWLGYGDENGRAALKTVSLSLYTTSGGRGEKVFEEVVAVSGARETSRSMRDAVENIVSRIKG